MRSVISCSPIGNEVWTDAITQSSLREQLVVVVERAVGEDVDLGPASTSMPSSVALSAWISSIRSSSASGDDVVAEPVRGRVVGDREVLEPAPGAAATICSSVCRPSDSVVWQCRSPRMSSSVISCGSPGPPGSAASSSPRPSRSSGGIHASPSALVDLLLGRAAQRLAGRVVEDPVLGDVQPPPHRVLAQRHVVRLGAREVLEHVAELVGLDDLEVHLHAGVGRHPRARVAGRAARTRSAAARRAPPPAPRGPWRWR